MADGYQNPQEILEALRRVAQQGSGAANFQSKRYTPPSQGVRDRQLGVSDARINALRSNPAMRPLIDQIAAGGDKPSGALGSLGKLGFDNPLAKIILGPLAIVDTPRRAIISGVREIVDVFDSDPATRGSISEFVNQASDTTYGFGTAFPMAGAKGRILGFIGDVALDPLTYATLGSYVPAKALIAGTNAKTQAVLGLKRIMGADARFQLARKAKEFGAADKAVSGIAAGGRSALFREAPDVAAAMGINRPGIYFFGSRLRVPLSGRFASALENGLTSARLSFFNSKRGAAIGASMTTSVGANMMGVDTSAIKFSLATGKESDPTKATKNLFLLSDIEEATGVMHMEYDTAVKEIRQILQDPNVEAAKDSVYQFLDVPQDRWADIIGRAPTEAEEVARQKIADVLTNLRQRVDAAWKEVDEGFPGIGEFSAYFPHVMTEDMAKLMDEATSVWAKQARQYFKMDLSETKGTFSARNMRAGMEFFGESPDRPYILTEADILGGVNRLNEISMQYVGIKAFETDAVEALGRYASHYADMLGRARVFKNAKSRSFTGSSAEERLVFDEQALVDAVENLRIRERVAAQSNEKSFSALSDAVAATERALAALVRGSSAERKAGPLRRTLQEMGNLSTEDALAQLVAARAKLQSARATMSESYQKLAAEFDEVGEQMESILALADLAQKEFDDASRAIDAAVAAYTTEWGDELIRQQAAKKAMDEVKEKLGVAQRGIADLEQSWDKHIKVREQLETFLKKLTEDPDALFFDDPSNLGLPLAFRTVRSMRNMRGEGLDIERGTRRTAQRKPWSADWTNSSDADVVALRRRFDPSGEFSGEELSRMRYYDPQDPSRSVATIIASSTGSVEDLRNLRKAIVWLVGRTVLANDGKIPVSTYSEMYEGMELLMRQASAISDELKGSASRARRAGQRDALRQVAEGKVPVSAVDGNALRQGLEEANTLRATLENRISSLLAELELVDAVPGLRKSMTDEMIMLSEEAAALPAGNRVELINSNVRAISNRLREIEKTAAKYRPANVIKREYDEVMAQKADIDKQLAKLEARAESAVRLGDADSERSIRNGAILRVAGLYGGVGEFVQNLAEAARMYSIRSQTEMVFQELAGHMEYVALVPTQEMYNRVLISVAKTHEKAAAQFRETVRQVTDFIMDLQNDLNQVSAVGPVTGATRGPLDSGVVTGSGQLLRNRSGNLIKGPDGNYISASKIVDYGSLRKNIEAAEAAYSESLKVEQTLRSLYNERANLLESLMSQGAEVAEQSATGVVSSNARQSLLKQLNETDEQIIALLGREGVELEADSAFGAVRARTPQQQEAAARYEALRDLHDKAQKQLDAASAAALEISEIDNYIAQLGRAVETDLRYDAGRRQFPQKGEVKKAAAGRQQISSEVEQLAARRNQLEANLVEAQQAELKLRQQLLDTSKEWYAANIFSDAQLYSSSSGKLYRLNVEAAIQTISRRNTTELKRNVSKAKSALSRAQRVARTREEVTRQGEIDPVTWLRGELNDLFENPVRADEANAVRAVLPELYYKWAVDRYGQRSRGLQLFDVDGGLALAHRLQELFSELDPTYKSRVNTTISSNLGKINRGGKILRSSHDAVYEPDRPRNPSFMVKDEDGRLIYIQLGDLVKTLRTTDRGVDRKTMEDVLNELTKALQADIEHANRLLDIDKRAASKGAKKFEASIDQKIGTDIAGTERELSILAEVANKLRAQAIGPKAAAQQNEIDNIVAEIERLTRLRARTGQQVENIVVDQLVGAGRKADDKLANRIEGLVERLRKYERAIEGERQAVVSAEGRAGALEEVRSLVDNHAEALAAYESGRKTFGQIMREATGEAELRANLGFYRRIGAVQATTGIGASLDRALAGGTMRSVNDFFAQLVGGTMFDPRQGYRTAKIIGGKVQSIVPYLDEYVTTFVRQDGKLVDGVGNLVNGLGQRVRENGEVIYEIRRGPSGRNESLPVMGAKSPYPTRNINPNDSFLGRARDAANRRHARVFAVTEDGSAVINDMAHLPVAESGQAAISGLDMMVGQNGYLRQMRLLVEIMEERIKEAEKLRPVRAKAQTRLTATETSLQQAEQTADVALAGKRPQQRIDNLRRKVEEVEQSLEYTIAQKRYQLNWFIKTMASYDSPEVFDYVFEVAAKTYDQRIVQLQELAAGYRAQAGAMARESKQEAALLQSAQMAEQQILKLQSERDVMAKGFPRTKYRDKTSSPIFEALFRPKLTAKELADLDAEYKTMLEQRRAISAQLDRTNKKPLANNTVARLEAQHNEIEARLNDIIRQRSLFYTQYDQLVLQGVEVADRLFTMLGSKDFQTLLRVTKTKNGPNAGVKNAASNAYNIIDEGESRSAADVLATILEGTEARAQGMAKDKNVVDARVAHLNKTFLNDPANKVWVKHQSMVTEINSIRSAESKRLMPVEKLREQRDRILAEIAQIDGAERRLQLDGFTDELNEAIDGFWAGKARPEGSRVEPGAETPKELGVRARRTVTEAEKARAAEVRGQKYYESSESLLGSQRAVLEAKLSPLQERRRALLQQLFDFEVLDFVNRQELDDLISTLKTLMNLSDRQVRELGLDIAVRDPKTGKALMGSGSEYPVANLLARRDEALKMLQAAQRRQLAPLRRNAKRAQERAVKAKRAGTQKQRAIKQKSQNLERRMKEKEDSLTAALKSAQNAYDNSVGLRGADDVVFQDVQNAVSEVQELLEMIRSAKVPKSGRNAAWEAEAVELINMASEMFANLKAAGYIPKGSVNKAAQAAIDAAPAGQAEFLRSANSMDPASFKVIAQYILKKKEHLDALAAVGEAQLEVQFLQGVKALAGDPAALRQYIDAFGEPPGLTLVKTFRDGMVEVGKNFPNTAFAKEYAELLQNVSRIQEPELARQLGKFLGPYTRMFKAYATLSPGFHIRNAFHNAFMLIAAGVSIENMRLGARFSKSWTEASGRGIVFADWLKTVPAEFQDRVKNAMLASWVSGGGMTDDALRNPTPFPAFLTGGSKKLGRWIEQHSRFMMAFDSIQKGADIAGAAGVVRRHLFDYENISNVDRVMRQFVPFWMWTSRNLPLQIQLMWTNPKPYQIWSSFKRNVEDKESDEAVPLWMRELGGFKLPVGEGLYATPDFGFNRVEEQIGQLRDPSQLLSQMNPLLRVPLELSTGTQFFGNRRFSDAPMEVSGGASTVIQPLLEALGYGETGEGGKKFVNERAYYALRNLLPPVGRLESMNPTTPIGRERANINPLLGFLGSPVRKLSPEMQEGELARRQRLLQELARRERTVNAPQE